MDETPAASRVVALWRYPVKSLQGEEREEIEIAPGGVRGDRAFGVADHEAATVLSAKREGRLLEARATLGDDGLRVTLPDGRTYERGPALDEALGHWLGRSLGVVEAAHVGAATFECPEDFERDDSALVTWEGVAGSFVDESALHLVSTSELARLARERPDLHWDVRRFRPNVLLDDGDAPLALVPGDRVRAGDVELEITKGCSRCVMTTRPQPGGLARELDVLRHVAREHDGVVGWRARVRHGGHLRRGDELVLVAPGAAR